MKRKLAYGMTAALTAATLSLTACGHYNNNSGTAAPGASSNGTSSNSAGSGNSTTSSGGTSTDPTTFNFGTNEAIPQLDPDGTAANVAFREEYLFYDRLVTYGATDTDIHPMLAKTWDISADGKTYTFHLRTDAMFHDGSPVTAAAVKYSFIRAIDVGKSAAGIFDGIVNKDSFQVVDDHTITIHLLKPYAGFLKALGTVYASVINPKLQEHYSGKDLGQAYIADHEMGSGPYTLKSWDRGHQMVLAANNTYWGGKPTMQTVNIFITPEPSTARLMLEKGQLDALEPNMISPDVVTKMQGESGIKIHTAPGFQINDIVMNTTKAPFTNKIVRQAIAYAIDYNSIIKNVYGGNAFRINGIVPKGMFGYDPNVSQYDYNPTKAKALLQQAGIKPGTTIEMDISTNNDIVSNTAVLVQADLQAVGLNIKIKQMAWPTFISDVTSGQDQMAMAGWTPDYADPDDNLWYFADSAMKGPGFNLAYYDNPQVDKLLLQGRTSTDPAERTKIYNQIQEIMAADEPYIFLAQVQVVEPARSWVNGLTINPMNTWFVPFNTVTKK